MQVCTADGGFGPCQCGGPSDTDGNTAGSGDNEGSTAGRSNTCGDGVAQAGECVLGSANECPADCEQGTSATSADGCELLAGIVGDEPSVWIEQAQLGLTAGDLKCEALGGDHVCDYEELVVIVQHGELGELAVGTTLWVHRITPAEVDGEIAAADLGGRCVDWTYGDNLLADGEYLELTAEGPVFHLDADSFYDGIDGSHAQPNELQCGETLRAIPCCNVTCL